MKGTPEAHSTELDRLDEIQAKKLKPLIRFVKAWKAFNSYKFINSFYLECFVVNFAKDLAPNFISMMGYPAVLEAIFVRLVNSKIPPSTIPYMSPSP